MEGLEEEKEEEFDVLIINDVVIFGILFCILGLVFWMSLSEVCLFKMFY